MTALAAPALRSRDRVRLSFLGIVRAEWVKLTSTRSTIWCLTLLILLSVAVGMALATGQVVKLTSVDERISRGAQLSVVTGGIPTAQLIAAVVGVLAITGEYGSGMIRATFTAVPRRTPVILAKVLVLAVVMFVTGVIALILSAALTSVLFIGSGHPIHFADPAVVTPIIAAAAYLAMVSVIAFSIGALVKSTAAGIAIALALYLAVPTVLLLIATATQSVWLSNIALFLPTGATGGVFYATYLAPGEVMEQFTPTGHLQLFAWQAFLIILTWMIAGVVAAMITVKSRDV